MFGINMLVSLVSGQISGLRLNSEQNGEINGKRNSLPALVHVKEKPGMCLPVVNVCHALPSLISCLLIAR